MDYLGFIGGTYAGNALSVDGERCINLYPEIATGNSKKPLVLVGTPGLNSHWKNDGSSVILPTQPHRGEWAGENRLFSVSGDTLYEIFADGTFQALGSVGNDASNSPVQIFSDGNNLFIVSAGFCYIANGVDVKKQYFDDPNTGLPDPTKPVTAETGAYVDGYFLVSRPGTRQYNVSNTDAFGVHWNILDFGSKAGSPDALSAVFVDHKEIWLLGEKTTEVYQDAGLPGPGTPFAPIAGGFIEQGCVAPFSVAKVANSLMWLAGDERGAGYLVKTNGFQPTRVSTPQMEQAIQDKRNYPKITDATAYSYDDQGHSLYVITFPSAFGGKGATWVYDATTNFLHERLLWENGQWYAHLGRFHAYTTLGGGVGAHYVGDWRSGKIYKMGVEYLDDDGQAIRRLRSAPHLSENEKYLTYDALQLDMQVGDTLLLDARNQPRAPILLMRKSRDGGHTWSAERQAYAGKVGQRLARVRWRQPGTTRLMTFEISSTEKIQHVWIGAYLDVHPGNGS